jgi:carbonic anhydrase
MKPLIDNARLSGQRPEEFARLAEGQSPQALFITCSDSRVVPALITGARPGELFALRTAAVGAEVRRDDLAAVPAVGAWLVHAADEPTCSDITDPTVAETVQNHVLTQMERLRVYPCIEKRLEAGELQLHGWYHEAHTGIVREHDAESGTFEML